MKPADIIFEARHILKDAEAGATPRQADAELLLYVGDALREAAVLAPLLFTVVGDLSCVSGQCEQAVTWRDAVQVVDVLATHAGPAVTPIDRATLDAFRPGWRTDPAGPARHWMPLQGDPLRFFIYPAAPVDQVLDVRYVKNPQAVGLDEFITDLPDLYQPALVDYVVYRAESKDDEHVLTQRAAASYVAFKAKFGAATPAA